MTVEKEFDIRALKGTKVRYAHPLSGFEGQVALARDRLVLGGIYTVDRTEIHTWHTKVFLEEVPDVGFNSCFFV